MSNDRGSQPQLFTFSLTLFTWCLVIVALPLTILPTFSERFEFPKAALIMTVGLLAWAAVLNSWSPLDIRSYWRRITTIQRVLIFGIVVFTIWSLVANLMSSSQPLASLFGQSYRFQGQVFFVSLGGLAAFIVTSAKRQITVMRRLSQAVAISGLLAVVTILFQWWLNFTQPSLLLPTYFGRMNGLFGNPNFAGAYIALAWVWWRLAFPGKIRWMLWPLYVIATLLTQSRGAVAALVIVACIEVVLQVIQAKRSELSWIKRLDNRSRGIILGLVVVGFIGMMAVSFMIRPISPYEYRNLIWIKAWNAMLSRPLLGWGYEQFGTPFVQSITINDPMRFLLVDKVHNEWLEMGVATGFPGMTAYIGIWLGAGWSLWHSKKHAASMTALLCLLSSVPIVGTNVVSVPTHLLLFIILGQALSPVSKQPAK